MSIAALLFALTHAKKAKRVSLCDSDDLYTNVSSIEELHKAITEDGVYVCECCGATYVLDGCAEHRQNTPRYCVECGTLFENYDEVNG